MIPAKFKTILTAFGLLVRLSLAAKYKPTASTQDSISLPLVPLNYTGVLAAFRMGWAEKTEYFGSYCAAGGAAGASGTKESAFYCR